MVRPYVRAELKGTRELERAFRELAEAITARVRAETLARAGQPIAEDGARRAPRKTGALAESVTIGTLANADVAITATDPKAHLKEFGTAHEPAQPFLRPAWDVGKARTLRMIRAAFWKRIQQVARRVARAGG